MPVALVTTSAAVTITPTDVVVVGLTATSAAVAITGPSHLVTISGSGIQGSSGPGYAATSTTSLALASSGSKTFTTQQGLAYTAGARVRATSAGDVTKWMEGVVTAYSGTTLTVAMDAVNGSGTFADWNINLAGESGVAGSGVSIAAQSFDFSASLNSSDVTFTLPVTGGQTLVPNSLQVYHNGVARLLGLGYTISGNEITTIGDGVPYPTGDKLFGSFWETA